MKMLQNIFQCDSRNRKHKSGCPVGINTIRVSEFDKCKSTNKHFSKFLTFQTKYHELFNFSADKRISINISNRMSAQQTITVVACATILIAMLSMCHCATMAPLCQPGILEEMPQHIKKVCMALENSDQLTTALKSYINNEAATLVSKSDDLLTNNYGKRTDVDHVFLRFGKRR